MNASALFESNEMAFENELIRASISNPENFGPMYEKHYKSIFRFLYQRLNQKDEAHDLTAEVFIKALLNIGKYEFRGKPFISWLYRIAYNELMQFFRHKKNHRTINADIQDLRFIQEEADIVYFEEFIPQLKELITGLHPDDLILVEMRYFERRPYKEIAEKMDCSARTVEGYRDNLFAKLDLKTRVGLVMYAMKHGKYSM